MSHMAPLDLALVELDDLQRGEDGAEGAVVVSHRKITSSLLAPRVRGVATRCASCRTSTSAGATRRTTVETLSHIPRLDASMRKGRVDSLVKGTAQKYKFGLFEWPHFRLLVTRDIIVQPCRQRLSLKLLGWLKAFLTSHGRCKDSAVIDRDIRRGMRARLAVAQTMDWGKTRQVQCDGGYHATREIY